ncbi:hypothetical protein [Pelagibacterium lentulum]|nr:hypothetical protein [Pelagibacterium lentulum]
MNIAKNCTFVDIGHSAQFLPEDGPSRLPRAPKRKRPQQFWQAFDDKALFYDCFWHIDGERVLLIGPPALNLQTHFDAAQFVANPSGQVLSPRFEPTRSMLWTEFRNVPKGTTDIGLKFAGLDFAIPVQPNQADNFAGTNLILTMNKNNALDWILHWLDWHVKLHSANAVLIFDNGSDAYSNEDLKAAIAAVDGITTAAIVSWPYSYGPFDPAVLFHPHWANFLQMASINMAFRRLAAQANAILNCDVDELVGREGTTNVFDAARQSPDGLVTLKGQWVESAVSEDEKAFPAHLGYRYRHRNPLRAICANKWCLDPSRDWLSPLSVMPNVHRIYGVPKTMGRNAPTNPFWHFKAINTNWKTNRRQGDESVSRHHRRLDSLDRAVESYLVAD